MIKKKKLFFMPVIVFLVQKVLMAIYTRDRQQIWSNLAFCTPFIMWIVVINNNPSLSGIWLSLFSEGSQDQTANRRMGPFQSLILSLSHFLPNSLFFRRQRPFWENNIYFAFRLSRGKYSMPQVLYNKLTHCLRCWCVLTSCPHIKTSGSSYFTKYFMNPAFFKMCLYLRCSNCIFYRRWKRTQRPEFKS